MKLNKIQKTVKEIKRLDKIINSYEELANKIIEGNIEDLKINFSYKDVTPKKKNKEDVLDSDGSLKNDCAGIQGGINTVWVTFNDDINCRVTKDETNQTEWSNFFSQTMYLKIIEETISDILKVRMSLENKLKKEFS